MALLIDRRLAVALFAPAAALAAPVPAADAEVWPYVVAQGDTLTRIADAYLQQRSGWRQLQQRNRVADARRLQPGRTLNIPLAWLRREATLAEVVYVRGDVRAADATPVRSGQALGAGTQLQVGEASSLVLRLADGTRLMLAPNTRARIEELLSYGRTGLHRALIGLDSGSIESQVTPSGTTVQPYRVRTPVATLGVRGTDFRAHAGEARAGVEVLSGAVGAAARREVRVDAGFGTTASPDGVAAPVPLLPAPALGTPPPSRSDQPLQATWPAVPGAQAYRAQLFAAADGSLWRDGRFSSPQARFDGNLPEGEWRLRVRAVDAAGIEGRDADARIDRVAPPPPPPPDHPKPPLLQTPMDGGSVDGDRVVLAWYAIEEGRRYRVQVAADAAFTRLQVDVSDDRPAPMALVQRTVALPPGRWWWRVAALGDDGVAGPFSAARSVELRPPPR